MIRALLFTVVFYVNTALFLILGSPLLLGPRSWAMAGLKAHARASLFWQRLIVGTRMELRGLENLPKGACLVASKHQSAWDTFALIPLFADPAIVMKAELGLIPLYGWFSYKFRHVLVRRDKGPAALRRLIRDAKDRAAQGRQVVIFPEGTRRAPGAPPDYKPGVVALYDGLSLPCVPVALNSGLFWPRRSFERRSGTIVVEFLPPIPAGENRKRFKMLLEQTIENGTARLVEEALAADPSLPRPTGPAEREKNISGTIS
jgi:1-acyl-sn-glycerol-3-phosphate acyltransferase